MFRFNDNSTQDRLSQVSTNKPTGDLGIIAVLGANNEFTNGNSNNALTQQSARQAPKTATQPKSSPTYSTEPFRLSLPAGWSPRTTTQCVSNQQAVATTYTNQSRTVIIYENTRPENCEGPLAADTYLNYDFTADGSSVAIATDSIVQCSKQDNPSCPKGDGQVSVFIGNASANDPASDTKNSLTNKTYFYSIIDNKIISDFAAQVKELTTLLNSFTIQ